MGAFALHPKGPPSFMTSESLWFLMSKGRIDGGIEAQFVSVRPLVGLPTQSIEQMGYSRE